MVFTGSRNGGPLDVIIVGGGQAKLRVGYYLRRAGLPFAIFDAEDGPGETRRHGQDSPRAFSPHRYSSLPVHLMPGDTE